MSQESKPAASHRSRDYAAIAVKTAIVTFIVSVGLIFVVSSTAELFDQQPLKAGIRKALKDEKTRFRVKGLLTTNPAVHWRVSLIEEHDGNLKAAIDEIELALGLLELHSAHRAVKEKYLARLQELNRKLKASGLAGNSG